MKKITLLLCSILCLSGVSAQAQQHRGAKQEPVRKVQNTSPRRVNQNVQEPYQLTATKYKIVDYYASYGTQDITLTTDGLYFLFSIYAENIVDNKVYTLEDMDENFTCFTDGDEYYFVDSTTYKQYFDADDGFHVEAVVYSGEVTFEITYYRNPVPKHYDSLSVTVPMAILGDYRDGYSAVEFYGYSADSSYYAQVDFACEGEIAGTYTEEDFDLNYCYMMVGEQEMEIVKITAEVTTITGGYQTEAYFYCYNGKCYHVSMTYKEPKATTKVNLNATNMEIDDYTSSSSQIMIYASNEEYNLSLDIYTDTIGGSFTEGDLYMYSNYSYVIDSNGKSYTIYSANIVITNDGGVYTVTGTLLCYGDVEFTLNLTQGGTALDEVEGTTTQGAMYDIQGRKIENPVAGQIVIRDGKKYIAQ